MGLRNWEGREQMGHFSGMVIAHLPCEKEV
jgi:hypothetical protein